MVTVSIAETPQIVKWI